MTISTTCRLIVLAFGVHTVTGRCYSLFGFSTCKKNAEIDLRFHFTPAWWVCNVYYRAAEIRNAKHILETTPIWSLVRGFPTLDDVTNMVDNGMFDRMFKQAVDYFRVNGEVVELLQDPDVTYGDLYQSFKAHPDEVLGLIDTMINAHVWDNDIETFVAEKRGLIRTAALIFAYLPTEMFTQYVPMMDEKALATGVVSSDKQLSNVSFTSTLLIHTSGQILL